MNCGFHLHPLPLPMVPKLAWVKVPPTRGRGANFSLPPSSPEHRVCAQGGSRRPQAGCPGADHSLPSVRVFQLTVSVAFLLFVSASGSCFLQGAMARVADGCPAAGPGKSGPGRRPGCRRGNIQCDVSVPMGPGAMVGGCVQTTQRLSFCLCTPCSHQAPPSCEAAAVDEGEALSGVADMLDRPPALPGESEWVPVLPSCRPQPGA